MRVCASCVKLLPFSFVMQRWAAVAALCLGFESSGCLMVRIVYYNTPTLAVAEHFDSRAVAASRTPLPLAHTPREAPFALAERDRTAFHSFDAWLEAAQTSAFVAIHDDQIVYERYFHGVTASSALPGFSMSKTFASALIGRATSQGLFPPLDEPITRAIPELARKKGYPAIRDEQLLRMISGIDFDEESLAGAQLYYSQDLRNWMYAFDTKWPAGTHYLYGSVNIQLLWAVLQRRLGHETVSHYFERELWGPLGAQDPASWSLDSKESGIEKFFGGFNASARDQARLGLLYLHGGALNGQQIVPRWWVERSLTPDPVAGWVHTTDGWVRRGMYQWFITRNGRAYFAKGYSGQYIFVVPDRHAVFVRFGEGYGNVDWSALFLRLADGLEQ
jgi:CubicO group peptidase (beta-lactamase class C family)